MTRRKLSEDEVALWRKVAETAERLNPAAKSHDLPLPKPKPQKKPRLREASPALPAFEVGSRASSELRGHDLLGSVSDRVARQPVQMDKKAFGRMKRGKLVPEGKIDLHGMTADQAHGALTGFIMRSHGEGKRLVLVITGKGKSKRDDGPIPTRRGVLKHQVPQWFALPPMKSCILQVAEAHIKHGGTGAYYVYLRRR
ncbi:Smr/MutS family protein [Shimia sp. MMG029]|uniref:Smr/MutS family protein n=1 Tax=Shimia sp. MMG029 TaxID=3021978 RepID=UPI0022FDDF8C|nr:Smr/MutS family protein [Shimia sp. MMG029]MDA5557358.1 Smr/MutS family protein [Shimia sp. MMG029]